MTVIDNGTKYNIKELFQSKALQIYWYLLNNGESGIREIQKDLKLNSPSSVSYQVAKLMSFGIVGQNKETEKYYVIEGVKTGILSFYVRLGNKMIPRFLLYFSIFFSGFILFLISLITNNIKTGPIEILFGIYLLIVSIIFILETVILLKNKPN